MVVNLESSWFSTWAAPVLLPCGLEAHDRNRKLFLKPHGEEGSRSKICNWVA